MRAGVQVAEFTKLDGVGRARLGTGRLQPALQPIVAQRAFMRFAVQRVDVHHAERTGRHAVAATVADVLLDHHGVELGLEQRAGRAGFQARGVMAVLADVTHHQPAALKRWLVLSRTPAGPAFSTKATWRQVLADSDPVLS